MKYSIVKLALIVISISCMFTSSAGASIINAASCSQSHVQAAINTAVSGDTVNVPAGSCTWSDVVSIPSAKKLVLKGAGIDSTIITGNTGGAVLDMSKSGARVTGFTLKQGAIKVDGSGWRIDNCKFQASYWSDGVQAASYDTVNGAHPVGVIDHCIFNNTRVVVTGTNYMLNENGTQHNFWIQPLGLGTNNAVFVEDCVFNGVADSINVIDSNYGGRYVFRYNTVNDMYVEAHSVQGNNRAVRSWEIYNNTFNQVSRAMWVPIFLRGGTGVVFNNTLTGTWGTSGIALDNVRSCENRETSGLCNGSSPWDGNQSGQAGYPCRDQIGRSTDSRLWTASSPYPPQALDPAYAWNNKHGANNVPFFQHGCAASAAHIQPGRDYFNNTVRPGYTPYTYPHPLTQGGVTPPPGEGSLSPPSNFRVLQ